LVVDMASIDRYPRCLRVDASPKVLLRGIVISQKV
jgi:hypothetical protein